MTTSRPNQTPAAPAAQGGGIGDRTAKGFAWLFAQSIGEKVFTLLGQVVLARLLGPDAFTQVALVGTLFVFATMLQQAGIMQVLVQRHHKFRIWQNAAFWMSMTVSLGAGLAMAGAAKPAAAFYGDPTLLGMLLVAALTLPINGLVVVPEAQLRGQMRFKAIAAVGGLAVAATQLLSVLLAWRGFGAYSFIIPLPIVAAMRSGLLWWIAKPTIRLHPHVRRWRYLFSDSAQLLIASMAMMLTYQGGQGVLGRLYPRQAAAGIYLFAWNLSDQSLRLLVNNLAGVLFPALNSIQGDSKRQNAAFLKAVRALLLVGLPICLLQAVLAGPVIRLVFGDKWLTAIPVLAALSLGMTSRLVVGPCESIFLAQRKYGLYMTIALVYAVAFFAAVIPAAIWAGASDAATGASVATGVCLGLLGPICLRLAVGPAGGGWIDVGRVYALPVVCGACAFAPGVFIVRAMPQTLVGDAAAIATVTAACGGLYALAIRVLARREFDDLWSRVRSVLRRGPRFAAGHCQGCGYDLRGLPAQVCPECGAVSAS